MFTTFKKAFELMEHTENHVIAEDMIGNVPVDAMKSMNLEPLEHESMFIDTLKDCIPNTSDGENGKGEKKECMTFIPEGSKERIAVLAPPGEMTQNLAGFLHIVLKKGRRGKGGADSEMEIVPSTHMVSSSLFFFFFP